MEYPFGLFMSAVLDKYLPNLLPIPSLLHFVVRETGDSTDAEQALLINRQTIGILGRSAKQDAVWAAVGKGNSIPARLNTPSHLENSVHQTDYLKLWFTYENVNLFFSNEEVKTRGVK